MVFRSFIIGQSCCEKQGKRYVNLLAGNLVGKPTIHGRTKNQIKSDR